MEPYELDSIHICSITGVGSSGRLSRRLPVERAGAAQAGNAYDGSR